MIEDLRHHRRRLTRWERLEMATDSLLERILRWMLAKSFGELARWEILLLAGGAILVALCFLNLLPSEKIWEQAGGYATRYIPQ